MTNQGSLDMDKKSSSLYVLERVVPSTATKILFSTSYSSQVTEQINTSYPIS